MPCTNYALQALLTWLFGQVALPTLGNLYLAFSTTAPTQAKGSAPFWNFTEPVAGTGGYARFGITNNNTEFTAIASEPASGYSIQNNVSIAVTASTGAWSTGATPLIAAGLWDSNTVGAGNLWAYGSLNPTVVVNQAGVAPTFTPAQMIATFT